MKIFIVTFRLWMGKQAEICEDLFRHPNIWQNHQGQSSKVCGHVVSYWRHHGTSHWILHHQWSGDSLLCVDDYFEQNESCIQIVYVMLFESLLDILIFSMTLWVPTCFNVLMFQFVILMFMCILNKSWCWLELLH